MQNSKGEKRASTAKIAIIYTVCNVLVKGIAFLTTPLFTRLLTQTEYGEYSNITSWVSILVIITSADLYASINRARYDFEKEMDKYLSSLLLLGNLVTLVFYVVFELNMNFLVEVMAMDAIYIRLMFIYFLFSPAFLLLQAKERIFNKYKSVIKLTMVTVLGSTIGSVILVFLMEDKLMGRFLGNYIVVACVDVVLWLYILLKGRGISLQHCHYALKLSLPLIPHNLAGNILITSDRIIINQICGPKDGALYSVAYTISMIASVLLTSLNQAWIPWLYGKMNSGEKKEIRDNSYIYIVCFGVLCVGIMLVTPEMVLIFGGEKYREACYVVAPVVVSVFFQFIYTLYVNIEFYLKKTFMISVATVLAAAINVLLNFIFVPQYGYVAAAYTTMIGYAFMFLLHYLIVRKQGEYVDIYDMRFIGIMILLIIVLLFVSLILYRNVILRYVLLGIYLLGVGTVIFKNRKMIIKLLRGK